MSELDSGMKRERVAVIGSGISALSAAHVISRSAEVTLVGADRRLGGHADTHRVPAPAGELAIDTGFIAHNDRTYPALPRLFAELGVETRPGWDEYASRTPVFFPRPPHAP